MSYQINCEDFELTPSIRQNVEDAVEKLASQIRREGRFTIFISKPCANIYDVKISTQYERQHLFGHAKKDNFLKALIAAKRVLLRQIHDRHDRRTTARHG